MSNANDPAVTDVVVVGAGLAGLAAAQLLRRERLAVLVLDSARPGGRATTDTRSGFRFNRGPHALYLGGPAERLLTALEVPLDGGPPAAPWISHGELRAPLPTGPVELARTPLLGVRGKVAYATVLRRVTRTNPSMLASTTFQSWLDDADMPEDAARLLQLLGRVATYTNAPEVVSADVVVGQLRQAARPGVRYLHGGWQTIVDALASGLDIRQAPVERVERDGEHVVVHATGGRQVVARSAVVAAGTPAAAARLLDREAFVVGPAADAACLELGTRTPARPSVLFDLDEPLYLSDHSVNAHLAPAGRAVVHVARYLPLGEQRSPQDLRRELEAHASRAGIVGDAVVEARYLHRMAACSAMPTAALGGLPGRPQVTASGLAGVFLAGDWVGPVGHLLDATLASAESAALSAVRTATLVGR